ncbi:M56 family metallopeptidase [Parerythrobacter aurantius]|uniref:M56 family metallopeptidase n=1 Tax=Parerythrobacter aurantius TaxID=3127706 RepID=UPI00324C0037
MTQWLLDTLLWTGALLALVLVLRRPVARTFGPQAAYALWVLPFARLLLPTLTLPAWMNPSPASDTPLPAIEVTAWTSPALDPALVTGPAPASAWAVDPVAVGIAAWLAGAAVFLVVRFRSYFELRRELLAEAREVGRIADGRLGVIRLVETPATGTPLAFGVLDRVVALPPRFLALAERPMRDLALAHELAHHRGGDLIANFAVQPLFALHWFNPLGWVGWRAMRRDQEAACDARVVRTADAGLRATYAQTIASFAAGPPMVSGLALAAPMACPVLGDKSIIHRLRSLTMSDISARRRWAGRSLLLAGALALPLTASVTYAEDADLAPEAPEAPEAPLAPSAPAAPEAPEAPEPPEAPEWMPEEDGSVVYTTTDDDGRTVERRIVLRQDTAGTGGRKLTVRTVDKDGNVTLEERIVPTFSFVDESGRRVSEAEFERHMEEMMRAKEAELEALGERIEKEMEMRFGNLGENIPVSFACEGGKGAKSLSSRAAAMAACADAMASDARNVAIRSLGAARKAVEVDRNLSPSECKEALEAIDAEIARLTVEI